MRIEVIDHVRLICIDSGQMMIGRARVYDLDRKAIITRVVMADEATGEYRRYATDELGRPVVEEKEGYLYTKMENGKARLKIELLEHKA